MNISDGTILLVEDDPDAVFLLQRALQKASVKNPLEIASDGQGAIEYLSHQGAYTDRERYPLPVLMLLDLKMPRKNGFEVLEWLRQQPGLKRLIVVVLTASSQVNDINRAYDLGGNSYLVKPTGVDELIEMIKDINRYWLALNERPELHNQTVARGASGQSAAA